MKNINFLIFFILTIFLLAPLFTHASIVPCGQSVDDPVTSYDERESCNLCHLFVGVSNIITFLTYDIALPASIIGFIIGGFFILTAAGSEERLKKGKNAVTFTIIGLLLVFGAWLIMDLILGNLVDKGYIPVWSAFPSAANCSQSYNMNTNSGPQAPVVCTSFTYSNFGPCQPNSIETRSITSTSPSGCSGGNPASLSQPCNYVPPGSTVPTGQGTAPVCSFIYSSWQPSICPASGNQTRSTLSSSPAGCVGNPVITRPCPTTPFQIAPKTFTIDQGNPAQPLIATFIDSNGNETDVSSGVTWVSSDSNIATVNTSGMAISGPQNGTVVITGTYTDPTTGNIYNNTITATVNSPRYSCINNQCAINQTNTNVTQYNDLSACQQACVQSPGNIPPTCSSFVYSGWGSCQTNNTQTRTVISLLPSGCTGGNPVTSQSCAYTSPTCSSFVYSGWGSCQTNNTQTRTVISSSPSGCTGGNPVISQSCAYIPPTTQNPYLEMQPLTTTIDQNNPTQQLSVYFHDSMGLVTDVTNSNIQWSPSTSITATVSSSGLVVPVSGGNNGKITSAATFYNSADQKYYSVFGEIYVKMPVLSLQTLTCTKVGPGNGPGKFVFVADNSFQNNKNLFDQEVNKLANLNFDPLTPNNFTTYRSETIGQNSCGSSQIIIKLINSNSYSACWGGPGYVFLTNLNCNSLGILAHELGHAIAGMSDEYFVTWAQNTPGQLPTMSTYPLNCASVPATPPSSGQTQASNFFNTNFGSNQSFQGCGQYGVNSYQWRDAYCDMMGGLPPNSGSCPNGSGGSNPTFGPADKYLLNKIINTW